MTDRRAKAYAILLILAGAAILGLIPLWGSGLLGMLISGGGE